MSILIGAEIEKALKNGSIRIEPLDRSQVGPGSIDLTLENDFRRTAAWRSVLSSTRS